MKLICINYLNSYKGKLFKLKKTDDIGMKGICGLGNVGNSCYINASLQILSQIDEMNHYMLSLTRVRDVPESTLLVEWIGLMKMIRENHGSILPHRFIEHLKQISLKKNRPEFSKRQQEDSVEFFEFMLECLHNSLNQIDTSLPVKKTGCLQVDQYLETNEKTDCSVISKLFLSCILNQYIHPETKTIEFYKLEHTYKIELSIPEKGNVTLYDCFVETFKEEFLHGENAWFDEKENKKKNVLKRSAMAHTPPILCIHLKRWKEDGSKKNIHIDSPLLLDITKYTIYKEKQQYALFGIINHEGGIRGGHYYSYVLRENHWFSLNDEHVQSISSEVLIHKSNYCLFYRKIK